MNTIAIRIITESFSKAIYFGILRPEAVTFIATIVVRCLFYLFD